MHPRLRSVAVQAPTIRVARQPVHWGLFHQQPNAGRSSGFFLRPSHQNPKTGAKGRGVGVGLRGVRTYRPGDTARPVDLQPQVVVRARDGVVMLVHDEVGAAGTPGARRVQRPVARDGEMGRVGTR